MPDVARTLDLPSGQRFEYWKHILTNTFVPLEVSTPGNGDDFRGLLRGCELGSLRFIEVSAEAHTARRTARSSAGPQTAWLTWQTRMRRTTTRPRPRPRARPRWRP